MHFDAAELPQAISAYSQVLEFKDSSYYDKALYKLAWSYYRDNHFVEAIKEFDRLVKWADDKKSSGDKFGSDLRPEAIQYLGVSFSEPDWNGDTVPDGETGLQRAGRLLPGPGERAPRQGGLPAAGRDLLRRHPVPRGHRRLQGPADQVAHYPEAPKIQDRIVQAYERDRNMVAAAKEREMLGRMYVKGTDWYKANQNNPDALAAAQQLSEDALLNAATNVHAAAQACRAQADRGQGPGQAGRVQADLPDLGRALREVPERLPQLQAGLRVLASSTPTPSTTRTSSTGPSPPTRTCATRCWTTASSATRPSTSSRPTRTSSSG